MRAVHSCKSWFITECFNAVLRFMFTRASDKTGGIEDNSKIFFVVFFSLNDNMLRPSLEPFNRHGSNKGSQYMFCMYILEKIVLFIIAELSLFKKSSAYRAIARPVNVRR